METQELKERIQLLINEQMKIKENSTQLLQGLFKKLENIKEVELIANMPSYILDAYLIYKRAYYSNYQEKHLSLNQFDKVGYLEKMEKEITLVEKDNLKDLIAKVGEKIEKGEIDLQELIRQINRSMEIKNENDRSIIK